MAGMIKRVAMVFEPQAWAAVHGRDSLTYKNRRTSSLRKARAAIEAMREPTDLMGNSLPATYKPGSHSATQIWRVMIDAALKEAA